jgi:hypothetical protein
MRNKVSGRVVGLAPFFFPLRAIIDMAAAVASPRRKIAAIWQRLRRAGSCEPLFGMPRQV